MRRLDIGRLALGLVILGLGGFLVLINLQLTSYEIIGLWPLLLIVPSVILLSLAVIVTPQESKPLRPMHGDTYDDLHRRTLIW